MADGNLWKGSGPKVYVEINGQNYWVPNPETLAVLGGWSPVQTVPDNQLLLDSGRPFPDLRVGNTIIADSGGKVYVMWADRQRHWIQNPVDLERDYGGWSPVQTVPDTGMALIPESAPTEAGIHVTNATDLGNGHHMQTFVHVESEGVVANCETHTWCTNLFVGFTGGVFLIGYRNDGQITGHSDLQKYGVDGTMIPFTQSNRTDVWQANIPRETDQIFIVHLWAPTPRLDDILRQADQLFQDIERVTKYIAEFCQNHPEICQVAQQTATLFQ
jgi:hypothetical protein